MKNEINLEKYKKRFNFKYDDAYHAAFFGDIEELKKYKEWFANLSTYKRVPQYVKDLYNIFEKQDVIAGAIHGSQIPTLQWLFENVQTPHAALLNYASEYPSLSVVDFWIQTKLPITCENLIHAVKFDEHWRQDYLYLRHLVKHFIANNIPVDNTLVWQLACNSDQVKLEILLELQDKSHLDMSCLLILASKRCKPTIKLWNTVFWIVMIQTRDNSLGSDININIITEHRPHIFTDLRFLKFILDEPSRKSDYKIDLFNRLVTQETLDYFVIDGKKKAIQYILDRAKDEDEGITNIKITEQTIELAIKHKQKLLLPYLKKLL